MTDARSFEALAADEEQLHGAVADSSDCYVCGETLPCQVLQLIAAARLELAEAKADAERWRFLRNNAARRAVASSLPDHADEHVAAVLVRAYKTSMEVGAFIGDPADLFAAQLDSNVDAARQAAPEAE